MTLIAPAATAAGRLAYVQTFLHLLACPLCTCELRCAGNGLQCTVCHRTYALLDGSDVPVLLPDDVFSYESHGPDRDAKRHVQDRFATIDRTLPEPHRSFATFLNLGYVPDERPQYAVRGPEGPSFNVPSTRLLFEVLGPCTLDGRVVLDLGAGRGGNVAMIQRCYEPSVIVGLDLSAANVEFCRQQHTIPRGGFVVGDVERLPFRDGAAEVVLNLESSHYYPHIERAFDEVWRVLAAGGEFLYADILPAGTFDMAARYLDRLGFAIMRDQDISSNVLLSCQAVAALRERVRHKLWDTFLVVPGSPEFESLRSRRTLYKILTLRKP